MIEVMNFLAWYGASDGSAIGSMFQTWQDIGFFSYLLPFLIIFALVFGILTKANLFSTGAEKKPNIAINAIIALAVGLIAIQVPAVSQFFSVVFPNLGIALAIILVILVIAGLFLGDKLGGKNWLNYILLGVAAIVIIIVLVNSANTLGLTAGQWIAENWSMLVAVLVIVGLVIAVVAGVSRTGKT